MIAISLPLSSSKCVFACVVCMQMHLGINNATWNPLQCLRWSFITFSPFFAAHKELYLSLSYHVETVIVLFLFSAAKHRFNSVYPWSLDSVQIFTVCLSFWTDYSNNLILFLYDVRESRIEIEHESHMIAWTCEIKGQLLFNRFSL